MCTFLLLFLLFLRHPLSLLVVWCASGPYSSTFSSFCPTFLFSSSELANSYCLLSWHVTLVLLSLVPLVSGSLLPLPSFLLFFLLHFSLLLYSTASLQHLLTTLSLFPLIADNHFWVLHHYFLLTLCWCACSAYLPSESPLLPPYSYNLHDVGPDIRSCGGRGCVSGWGQDRQGKDERLFRFIIFYFAITAYCFGVPEGGIHWEKHCKWSVSVNRLTVLP